MQLLVILRQTTRFLVLLLLLSGGTIGHAGEPTLALKAALPKVLILGDSISMGYTEPVKKLLQGKAEVSRPKENCQHTGYGLKRLETWLGEEKWAVIHFNWGIWDTHMLDAKNTLVRVEAGRSDLHLRYTPAQYADNLTVLVKQLEANGAKLVWAHTTPVMSRTGERFQAVPKLNAAAAKLMQARKIPVNDLYEFVLPHAKEWQEADRVHFNKLGNEHLAQQVSESILAALKTKAD